MKTIEFLVLTFTLVMFSSSIVYADIAVFPSAGDLSVIFYGGIAILLIAIISYFLIRRLRKNKKVRKKNVA